MTISARRAVGRFRLAFLDALFPPRCPLCDALVPAHGEPCGSCARSLHRLEGDAFLPHLPGGAIARCRSCLAYEGRLREALQDFKYQERFDLAQFLTEALACDAGMFGPQDSVIPVPLHPQRLRERGFNQAAILARGVGRALGVRIDLDSLVRVRDIPPQVGLERAERIGNVKGAFTVLPGRRGRIEGRKVLIIDDVLTTGATVGECARALRKAGAASVAALTVARAL